MKKAGLNGYAYHFSVDYDVVPTTTIPNGMLENETV